MIKIDKSISVSENEHKLKGRMHRIIGNISTQIDRVFSIKRIRTLEEAKAEWQQIFSIIDNLVEAQEEEKIGLQLAKEIPMSDQAIKGEAFVKRQSDCLDVYSRLPRVRKAYKKLLLQQLKSEPDEHKSIAIQALFENNEADIQKLWRTIPFAIIDEIEGVEFIRSPEKLIETYSVIEESMKGFFEKTAMKNLLTMIPSISLN